MVVVSATLKPVALMDLIKHHADGNLGSAWRG